MIQHVTNWLEAYHDGELSGRRLQQVQDHLNQCTACRTELEELQALRALLQENPATAAPTPPDRFVAQVGLRLPRRQRRTSVGGKILETGWRLVPVGLVGAWGFVQATFLVAALVLIALQLGVGSSTLGELIPTAREGAWLAGVLEIPGLELDALTQTFLQLAGTAILSTLLNFGALAVIAGLYWSWLATLWARRRHQVQSISR